MAGLADTIARLRSKPGAATAATTRLVPLKNFGSNPGELRGWCFAPPGGRPMAPLVVVLHGCTQNAVSYDLGSGWSDLAADYGFALLFPEQQSSNNPNGCFNWFNPADIRRGSGEALSIREMIEAMCLRHSIDTSRIYVTGLSAGGAMACAMLANYPDVFAGGAPIAALPFDTAHGVPQALERMRGQGLPSPEVLGRLARDAFPHTGPWPRISVWHGGSDRTVTPANGRAIVDQWRYLHNLQVEPDHRDMVAGFPHHVWLDETGNAVIEEYRITGLGHGTPLATRGADGYGRAGPYMLEAGISSTWQIANGWGLLGERVERAPHMPGSDPSPSVGDTHLHHAPAHRVGTVIEDALRAAGLMR